MSKARHYLLLGFFLSAEQKEGLFPASWEGRHRLCLNQNTTKVLFSESPNFQKEVGPVCKEKKKRNGVSSFMNQDTNTQTMFHLSAHGHIHFNSHHSDPGKNKESESGSALFL